MNNKSGGMRERERNRERETDSQIKTGGDLDRDRQTGWVIQCMELI